MGEADFGLRSIRAGGGGGRVLLMSRRSDRKRTAPAYLIADNSENILHDPPVGFLLMVRSAAADGVEEVGDILVRLVGCREMIGNVPRFRYLPKRSPRQHRDQYPSLSYKQGKWVVVQLSDASEPVSAEGSL